MWSTKVDSAEPEVRSAKYKSAFSTFANIFWMSLESRSFLSRWRGRGKGLRWLAIHCNRRFASYNLPVISCLSGLTTPGNSTLNKSELFFCRYIFCRGKWIFKTLLTFIRRQRRTYVSKPSTRELYDEFFFNRTYTRAVLFTHPDSQTCKRVIKK